MFAIDDSGSIHRHRWPIIQHFIQSVIEELEVGPNHAHVSMMTFNDVSRIHFDLNQYNRKQDVMQAVEYVKFKGGKTNTAAMFELMFTEVFREEKGDRPREYFDIWTSVRSIVFGNKLLVPDYT